MENNKIENLIEIDVDLMDLTEMNKLTLTEFLLLKTLFYKAKGKSKDDVFSLSIKDVDTYWIITKIISSINGKLFNVQKDFGDQGLGLINVEALKLLRVMPTAEYNKFPKVIQIHINPEMASKIASLSKYCSIKSPLSA